MNVENRTIFEGDNLHILRGFDSETIDLIYLDPPFNSNKTYEAPIGSEAAGAAFKDAWTLSDLDNAWHSELAEHEPGLYSAISVTEFTHSPSMKAYLIMMSIRMLELHRVLKPTGSIYLHCDPTVSPYLKMMMDAVFGKDNFRNEIAWGYSNSGQPARFFAKRHDVILLYTKTDKAYWRDYKTEDGLTPNDWWKDMPPLNSVANERFGYPTQKPQALLERIIKASSKPGDIVLDPFCGCATTCIAAEALQRQWIGIDLSEKAFELVEMRLKRFLGPDIPDRLEPEEPRQIHIETLFDSKDLSTLGDLSEGELQQFKVYKRVMFDMQEGKCNGCQRPFYFRNMTIDHIHPRSKGGTDDLDNLQLLCSTCNSTKGDRTHEYLIQALKEQGVLWE